VLFRLLRHIYGADHVTYVRNITDVDDKINARAAERNISIRDLTEETYSAFKSDVAALGCLDPTYEPRATEYISRTDGTLDMITLIKRLIEGDFAYVEQGHVLFRVAKMPDYGKLSKRSLDEMIAGARVEVAPYKHDPMDFVLWKPSRPDEPGWESPWGRGRPGWHIECSAMSAALLGEFFDIHGGGIDLLFPHHENEIAQSRCAFHTPVMANYWMHNGFLQVEGEKMSKSLGNFVTIRELRNEWSGQVLRLHMLRTHYRQPLDWTASGLHECKRVIDHWYDILGDMEISGDESPDEEALESLRDDMNTPKIIARLHAIANEIRGPASGLHAIELKRKLKASGRLLGILGLTKGEHLHLDPRRPEIDEATAKKVQALLEQRALARKTKNFKESDRIRDELAKMGVVLKDSKDGTTWEIAR
jgi:cysteinyl-tRNA synthetase